MYRYLAHLIFAVSGLCIGILIPEGGHMPLIVALSSLGVLSFLLLLAGKGFRPAEQTIVGSVSGDARKRVVLRPTDVALSMPGEGPLEIEFGPES